jgi:hypothetical protein
MRYVRGSSVLASCTHAHTASVLYTYSTQHHHASKGNEFVIRKMKTQRNLLQKAAGTTSSMGKQASRRLSTIGGGAYKGTAL